MTTHTHYEGCWDSGPKHYECALREVKKLQEVNTKARNEADAMEEFLGAAARHVKRIEAKQNKPWVGLTGDEIENLPKGGTWWEIIRAAEEILKEKNSG